ncbi:MAG TPA: branched-chain amino acid ABC transporter permease [Herpetosiphonaceae bacterium]|nr:branched-chain amino acid ABC transporter permease [Herpetosiphonaceae bacterium]
MTTRGVSQGGEPISVKPPFLTKRRAIIIISLMVFLAFFGLPLINILERMIDSPKQLLQQIIVGLTKGTYLAIIALGYTLVYGIIELINFAHAEVYMIGAFASLSLISIFGLNDAANKPSGLQIALMLPIILILVMAFTAMLNVSIELLAYRRLRNAPRLAPLISAIGVSFILQNIGILWGDRRLWNGIGLQSVGQAMGSSAVGPKSFPPLLPSGQVFFIPSSWFTLAYKDLLVILISFTLLAALYMFVRYTKLGKAMRATAQDRDAARLMGINANRTISLTFLIGGALAGAAGMLVGLYNGTAVFNMGFTAGLLSFTAAVLGGIGNILGSALGGLLIGLFLALSDQYINARWSNAVIFGILVLILVFRPTGLLGEEGGQKA